ncbi:MAG: N-glycosylase/DNA lyase [Nitrososphaerota archaeon]|nr:N-glycosylase/DNA lyase [Candidatus Bathyarchaeota archaeon]MDW8048614.1 N-glycosylase/DNA lyase [Nitrososphaerota archaeon]
MKMFVKGSADKVVEYVERLKESQVKVLVDHRINEFIETGKKSDTEIFKELCYCILTANFSAEKSMRIQNAIGDGFITLPECELTYALRSLGHRFPSSRSRYIVEARKLKDGIKELIASFSDPYQLRDWIAENVRGLGLKEASHFLRNIGFLDFAILDFHIIDLLVECGVISRPKTLTRKKYLEIEEMMKQLASKVRLTLGELDLYLWWIKTGKILK